MTDEQPKNWEEAIRYKLVQYIEKYHHVPHKCLITPGVHKNLKMSMEDKLNKKLPEDFKIEYLMGLPVEIIEYSTPIRNKIVFVMEI